MNKTNEWLPSISSGGNKVKLNGVHFVKLPSILAMATKSLVNSKVFEFLMGQ
jgi:hypothetical protein